MLARPDDVQYWHDRLRGTERANRYQIFAAGIVARLEANAEPDRVVLLGDSIIAGLDGTALHPAALNLGVGFDKVHTLAERVGTYNSLQRARGIVVSVGTNDLPFRGIDSIEKGYRVLLARLPKHIPLLVSAVLPVDDRLVKGRPLEKIAQINERVGALCAGHPSCMFVPAPDELTDAAGRLKVQFHEGDGLHLNAAGYAVWKPVLRSALQRKLSEVSPSPRSTDP